MSQDYNLIDSKEHLIPNLVKSYLLKNLNQNKRPLDKYMNDLEKEIILKALKVCNGNKRNTAALLNMKYTTFVERVKKHDIKVNKKMFFENILD
jgi:DNA-binding NtrC family response regulator